MKIKVSLSRYLKGPWRFQLYLRPFGLADWDQGFVLVDNIIKVYRKEEEIALKIASTTIHELIHQIDFAREEEEVHAATWILCEHLHRNVMRRVEKAFNPQWRKEIREEKKKIGVIDL